MKTITAGGRQYDLYYLTGTVVRDNSYVISRTHVSGGYNRPIQSNTQDTGYNELIILDNTGREHAIRVTDFYLQCRENHELTLVWAIKKGKKRGPYIAIKNHNTLQTYYHEASLRDMHTPSNWIGLAILALSFFIAQSSWGLPAGIVTALAVFLVLGIVYYQVSIAKARVFKNDLWLYV